MYTPYDAYLYPSPMYTSSFCNHFTDESQSSSRHNLEQPTKNYGLIQLKDYGSEPFVVNIDEMTKINSTYRTALWTGKHLQLTLDRKSTRLNSSHANISYAVFCLKKKNITN